MGGGEGERAYPKVSLATSRTTETRTALAFPLLFLPAALAGALRARGRIGDAFAEGSGGAGTTLARFRARVSESGVPAAGNLAGTGVFGAQASFQGS